MNDSSNGLQVTKSKSKKLKFKRSKDYSPDKLKQKEQRHNKRDRRLKLDLLRLDELAVIDELEEFDEMLSDYEELV